METNNHSVISKESDDGHQFVIDTEISQMIPAQTPQERKLLEASIEVDGCRDHLVVGVIDGEDGPPILLDGHNRCQICQVNELPYRVVKKNLSDRVAALAWVIENQLGRRNLTPLQASVLRGTRYNQEKAKTTNPEGRNQHSEAVRQNGEQPHTHKRLAVEYGVSPKKIEREGKLAFAIETLATNTGRDARQKILTGQVGLSRKDLVWVAEELTPEEQKRLLAQSKQKIKKKVQEIRAQKEEQAPVEHQKVGEAEIEPEEVPQTLEEPPVDSPGTQPTTDQGGDEDHAAGGGLGPNTLDDLDHMPPDLVARFITTRGQGYVEEVAAYLKQWLDDQIARNSKIASAQLDADDVHDRVGA